MKRVIKSMEPRYLHPSLELVKYSDYKNLT